MYNHRRRCLGCVTLGLRLTAQCQVEFIVGPLGIRSYQIGLVGVEKSQGLGVLSILICHAVAEMVNYTHRKRQNISEGKCVSDCV